MSLLRKMTAIFIVLVVSVQNSAACTGPKQSAQEFFNDAKEVFRARVTKVELSKFRIKMGKEMRRRDVLVHYELKETLKGRPRKYGPVLTHIEYLGGCGVPVTVGLDYLFYIQPFPDGMTKEMTGNSNGMISIFGTRSLPPNEKWAEKVMLKIRSFRKGE